MGLHRKTRCKDIRESKNEGQHGCTHGPPSHKGEERDVEGGLGSRTRRSSCVCILVGPNPLRSFHSSDFCGQAFALVFNNLFGSDLGIGNNGWNPPPIEQGRWGRGAAHPDHNAELAARNDTFERTKYVWVSSAPCAYMYTGGPRLAVCILYNGVDWAIPRCGASPMLYFTHRALRERDHNAAPAQCCDALRVRFLRCRGGDGGGGVRE